MVGGLTTATYGLGSVILAPIARMMVENMGITSTFKVLGIVYLIVICVGAFLITPCPAGFVPEGYTPPAPVQGQKGPEDKTWSQMIKDPIFYVLFIMLVCGAFFGLMMISQCSPVAQNMIGMDVATAATIVSVLALCNAAGRVLCGFISDKLGRMTSTSGNLPGSRGNRIGSGMEIRYRRSVEDTLYPRCLLRRFLLRRIYGYFPCIYSRPVRCEKQRCKLRYHVYRIRRSRGTRTYDHVQPVCENSELQHSDSLIALALSVVGFILTFVYRAMSKAKK